MPDESHEMTSAPLHGPLLSVVVPCFNEQDVIEPLHSRLLQVLGPEKIDFEIIFVNDGSKDRTAEMLDAICRSDPRFKVMHFSRNFGHQAAVTAGLHEAKGNCAVVIDADLQDPPELILEMIKLWREGYQVVYAQ
jgi:dolichol-phosphate mannosyltransferase